MLSGKALRGKRNLIISEVNKSGKRYKKNWECYIHLWRHRCKKQLPLSDFFLTYYHEFSYQHAFQIPYKAWKERLNLTKSLHQRKLEWLLKVQNHILHYELWTGNTNKSTEANITRNENGRKNLIIKRSPTNEIRWEMNQCGRLTLHLRSRCTGALFVRTMSNGPAPSSSSSG